MDLSQNHNASGWRKKGRLLGVLFLTVLAVATGLSLKAFAGPSYNNREFGLSLQIPQDFAREVQIKAEGKVLYFIYKEVQALKPEIPLGVVGRVEIYDKATNTKEDLEQLTDMYGLRIIGENSKYYFGVAHATDVQVPPDASEQLKTRFRELEAEFDEVIKSVRIAEVR